MKVKAIKTKVTFPLGERSRQNLEWSLGNNSVKRPPKDSRLMQGQRKISFAFGDYTSAVVVENGAMDVATGEFYPQYADISDPSLWEYDLAALQGGYTAKQTKTLYKTSFSNGQHWVKPLTNVERETVIRAAVTFFAQNNVRFNYADEPEINAAFNPMDEDKAELIELIVAAAFHLVKYHNFNGTYADVLEIQKCLNLDTYKTIAEFRPNYWINQCFRKAHTLLEKESPANAIDLADTLDTGWLKVCRYALEFYIHDYLDTAGRNACIQYLLRYWADELGVEDLHENKALVIAAETADLNRDMWAYAKQHPQPDILDDHFEKVFSGE